MSVLSMMAHTLSYKEETGGYLDEETGDYVKGSSKWIEDYCACDIVPAGKANTIKLEDGTMDTYSYTIRNLPLSCREFKYGDTIRIKLYGNNFNRDREDVNFTSDGKWILANGTVVGREGEHTEYLVREFKVLGFHRYQLQCKMWV